MKMRCGGARPTGIGGTGAPMCLLSTLKPWAPSFGAVSPVQAHYIRNEGTVWSMGPMGGSTG